MVILYFGFVRGEQFDFTLPLLRQIWQSWSPIRLFITSDSHVDSSTGSKSMTDAVSDDSLKHTSDGLNSRGKNSTWCTAGGASNEMNADTV